MTKEKSSIAEVMYGGCLLSKTQSSFYLLLNKHKYKTWWFLQGLHHTCRSWLENPNPVTLKES